MRKEFGLYDDNGNCFIRGIHDTDDGEEISRNLDRYTSLREVSEDTPEAIDAEHYIPLLKKFIENYPDSVTAMEIREAGTPLLDDYNDTLPTFLLAWIAYKDCLLYTSPSPRDRQKSRMPSSA